MYWVRVGNSELTSTLKANFGRPQNQILKTYDSISIELIEFYEFEFFSLICCHLI